MTKHFLVPLLLSNYSMAVSLTGWKSEKFFHRAILITSLQLFFLVSAVIILVHPKIKLMEEFLFLAGEIVASAIVIMVFFRPFATWIYIKLNVLSAYKTQATSIPNIAISIGCCCTTGLLLLAAIALEFYKSTN